MAESATDYLKSKPDSPVLVPPPLREALHDLPFTEMGWENFERLCARLGEEIADDVKVSAVYGTQGQKQRGIDINIRRHTARSLIQSRRTKTVSAGKLKKAVDDFVDGGWDDADTFIYATAASAAATDVQDERDVQADRLEEDGIDFELWDQQELSRKLKDRPDLVEEFFGEGWLDAFCPAHAKPASMRRLALEAAAAIGLDRERRPILLTEDAGKGVQNAVRKLLEDAPGQIDAVSAVLNIDDKAQAAREAVNLIKSPNTDIEHGSFRLWIVLAHVAGRAGQWSASADAWEHVAQMRGEHAASLIEASVSSEVAGDPDRAAALRDRARAADPSNIKVQLSDIDPIDDHHIRLRRLEALNPIDGNDRALVECHKVLAYLMLDDFPAAEAALTAARQLAPHLLQIKILDVNIGVHRARMEVVADRSVNDTAVKKHEASALAVRAELHAQRRWHEAARTLMLAVDAATVRIDLDRAGQLLDSATDEERTVGDGATSLAAAALRGRHWTQALRLINNLDGEEADRIRATAKLALGFDQNGLCRQRLEDLVVAGGPEATDAALALLLDAGLRRGQWSEAAARHLIGSKRVDVLSMRAFHLSADGHYTAAVKTLKPYRGEPWAKRVLFVIANDTDDPQAAALAEDVLTTNPDRTLRLHCARALMRGDHLARAEAEARTVAEDEAASPMLRGDAYRTLVDVLDRGKRWDLAHDELASWQVMHPTDTRIGAWRARIGNRRALASQPSRP